MEKIEEKDIKYDEVIRSYKLALDLTKRKEDLLDWQSFQFNKFTNAFIQHFYFNPGKFYFNKKGKLKTKSPDSYSTEGMGWLVNQSQHKAKGIIKAEKEAILATGNKSSPPNYKVKASPGWIKKSRTKHFDYFVRFSFAFADERATPIYVPARSHKALNKALKNSWKLVEGCEIFKDKNSKWYVRVFVKKTVARPHFKSASFIGYDVGISHSVANSQGYLGKNLAKINRKEQKKVSERQRQLAIRSPNGSGPKYSRSKKSVQKQQLDVEAQRAVGRAKTHGQSLVVENPKVLANLKVKNKWARSYFANRVLVLAREAGVLCLTVHPAYTSQRCFVCGLINWQNRNGVIFKCIGCGHAAHADTNGACNIAVKGQYLCETFIARQVAVF